MTAPTDTAGDEESAWIAAAQAGDRRAFAPLIDRYWEPLYRWLCYLTHDPHQAEDLTQETFLKAYAAVGTFRLGSHFRAWLFRIGHNNFVNQRRESRRTRLELPADLPSAGHGPVGEVLSREACLRLAEAIHKLPTDFRAALLLRVEQDLSFKQIAAVLNTTEETARWRVFKARQKLTTVLAPDLLPAHLAAPGGKLPADPSESE